MSPVDEVLGSTVIALAAILISLAGFALSILTLVLDRRRQSRDLFLSLQRHLTSPEQQAARRLLFLEQRTAEDFARLRRKDPASYDAINSAVSSFEILAMYARRGFVSRRLVLEEFGGLVGRVWLAAEPMITARIESDGYALWPNLRRLGPECLSERATTTGP